MIIPCFSHFFFENCKITEYNDLRSLLNLQMEQSMKLTKLSVAIAVASMSTFAFAGGPDMQAMPHNNMFHGGMFLGASVSDFNGDNGFGLVGGYNNDYMTASLVVDFARVNTTGSRSQWTINLSPEAAYRQRISTTNLFWKAGMGGHYQILTRKTGGDRNNWGVGALAGIDYQAARNIQLSASLYPVSYDRDRTSSSSRTTTWDFFNSGSINIAYVF
jgi:hypothetical protein